MTRLIRARRGQSTAEYAVLFGIVIGAAIAMQQYVKTRLQGAIQKQAAAYQTAAEGAAAFEPTRLSGSQSAADMAMEGSHTGKVQTHSESGTGVKKATD